MKKFFLVVLATVLLTGSAMAAVCGGDYIEAEGVAYFDKKNPQSPNEMRRIAIMDAYRYLAEQVDALYVSAGSTVRNLRDLDDEINTKVTAVLRGAKIKEVIRERDGSFRAIVCMPAYGSQSVASVVLKEVEVEDFPKPKVVNLPSASYTGLIIDCKGKGLSQAIAPAIKSVDGMEVYAYKNLGYDTAVNRGMIDYSTSVTSGVERAGSSPLVVKAVKVSGDCDVVVSAADADKILNANQAAHFLNDCAVVFVR